MNRRQAIVMFVVVACLVAVAAAFLVRLHLMQRLGQPGLKVVAVPLHDEIGKEATTNSVFLPELVLDFTSQVAPVTRTELDWLPPDTTYGRRLYSAKDGFTMQVSVVLMGADRTSIHKPQYCLYGQGWRIDQQEKAFVPMSQPHAYQLPIMKLTTTLVSSGATAGGDVWRGIYLYWFVADGQLTADHVERMWWMARDLVTQGILQRWAYVTCFAVCRPGGEEETFARMQRFLASAVPEFQLVAGPPERSSAAPAALGGAFAPAFALRVTGRGDRFGAGIPDFLLPH
jgi:hypothetical protein